MCAFALLKATFWFYDCKIRAFLSYIRENIAKEREQFEKK